MWPCVAPLSPASRACAAGGARDFRSSPALRLVALERIDDRRARTPGRAHAQDRQALSRRARERAAPCASRAATTTPPSAGAGDLRAHGTDRARAHSADTEAEIDAQWAAIEPHVGEQLKARYRSARALLATSRVRAAERQRNRCRGRADVRRRRRSLRTNRIGSRRDDQTTHPPRTPPQPSLTCPSSNPCLRRPASRPR